MSSKVAYYLQEHLLGEVLTASHVCKQFSTDASVFTVTPSIVLYPKNEQDVRKTARFTWQLAERGRTIPITARGFGTDQTGAALGSGIIMVFPAHMNRILELDTKIGLVTVEPGITFGKLQQALHTHSRFLPPFPASLEYSTIGGAVANNASGEKSLKYGSMRGYVKGLRVVLANGEIIETRRLNKRELSKKLGLVTFEGEIYRSLDALIEENQPLIKETKLGVSKNTAGYELADIKHKDGSFDLTPLFVGSQGTLGIVTEVVLTTELHNPQTTLIAAFFDDLRVAEEVITEIRKWSDGPSVIEAVDGQLLASVHRHNPNQLKDMISEPFPKLVLLIEFDDLSARVQKRLAKKTQKTLDHYQISHQTETEESGKERLWKIRQAVATALTQAENNLRALPFIDDGIVPIDRFNDYIEAVYALFTKYHLQAAMWGHAGDAHLHMQPFMDLNQVGDRQKVFRLIDEYYQMVISMGGSTSGERGDGRIRAPYLKALYGEDIYGLFQKVKQFFDPYGTLNPGVKINVELEDIKPLLRYEYSLDHLYNHLPHS